MNNDLYEYTGTSDKLKNAVVTIERETDKSYFVNYRPDGGGASRNRTGFKRKLEASPIHGRALA